MDDHRVTRGRGQPTASLQQARRFGRDGLPGARPHAELSSHLRAGRRGVRLCDHPSKPSDIPSKPPQDSVVADLARDDEVAVNLDRSSRR